MMNMETPELNPCPFCGGKNIELRDTSKHWQCFAAKIVCECAVSIEISSNSFERAKEIAVTQWNTRAPQEPQWEQMTEETTFQDGEELLAIIRRRRVCVEYVLDGDEFVAAIPSSNSVSVGFQRHKISKFIRFPK